MTKEQQFEIIQAANPAPDDYHTWIHSVDDIKTFKEVLVNYDPAPDYTAAMMKMAERFGLLPVYSSHPIIPGTFVTPFKMEAENYGKPVYEKMVVTNEVAWIDEIEGIYTGR